MEPEARVGKYLINRCNDNKPFVTVRCLLRELGLSTSQKTHINGVLYKTFSGKENPLGLPKQYRLVLRSDKKPFWGVVRKSKDSTIVDPKITCAWEAYDALVECVGDPVQFDPVLYQAAGVSTIQDVAALLKTHVLDPHENVFLTAPETLTLHILGSPPTDAVILECDTIVGKQRDHAKCVVLGMAINHFIGANPGKKLILSTCNPGTHAILANVLKTTEYLASLDISLELGRPAIQHA